jgi:hypothetical protein
MKDTLERMCETLPGESQGSGILFEQEIKTRFSYLLSKGERNEV